LVLIFPHIRPKLVYFKTVIMVFGFILYLVDLSTLKPW
jgi:hypothetical protein